MTKLLSWIKINALEIALVLLGLLIIGFTAWFVYYIKEHTDAVFKETAATALQKDLITKKKSDNKKSEPPAPTPQSASPRAPSAPAVKPPAKEILSYTNKDWGLSFRYYKGGPVYDQYETISWNSDQGSDLMNMTAQKAEKAVSYHPAPGGQGIVCKYQVDTNTWTYEDNGNTKPCNYKSATISGIDIFKWYARYTASDNNWAKYFYFAPTQDKKFVFGFSREYTYTGETAYQGEDQRLNDIEKHIADFIALNPSLL